MCSLCSLNIFVCFLRFQCTRHLVRGLFVLTAVKNIHQKHDCPGEVVLVSSFGYWKQERNQTICIGEIKNVGSFPVPQGPRTKILMTSFRLTLAFPELRAWLNGALKWTFPKLSVTLIQARREYFVLWKITCVCSMMTLNKSFFFNHVSIFPFIINKWGLAHIN